MRITVMDQARQLAVSNWIFVWFTHKYPTSMPWFRHDKSLSYSSWAFGRLSAVKFD